VPSVGTWCSVLPIASLVPQFSPKPWLAPLPVPSWNVTMSSFHRRQVGPAVYTVYRWDPIARWPPPSPFEPFESRSRSPNDEAGKIANDSTATRLASPLLVPNRDGTPHSSRAALDAAKRSLPPALCCRSSILQGHAASAPASLSSHQRQRLRKGQPCLCRCSLRHRPLPSKLLVLICPSDALFVDQQSFPDALFVDQQSFPA
jgi:hypothetical protein